MIDVLTFLGNHCRRLKTVGLVIVVAFVLAGLAAPAYAQIIPCGFNPVNWKPLPNCTLNFLFVMFVRIFYWLLGMAAIVAFLFVVYGGVRMLWASYVGDFGNPEQEVANAKKTIGGALIGLIIILTAWLVVNTLLLTIFCIRTGLAAKLAEYFRYVGTPCP